MKKQRSILYRAFLAGISAIYFFTNVAAVHASESTFWTERRRASFQKARGEEDISIGRLSTIPNSQMVLAQLPRASPMALGESLPSQNPAGNNGKKEPFSLGSKTGDWLGKLVMPYGSVNELYLSPKPDAPFIVHIQDAHGILEAQRNIASMIGLLAQEPGIRLVGLEGASGPFSLAPYRDFPTPAMRQDVADFFLNKGLIAGPEYAGLTLPQSPQFFGAENRDLYLANVNALKTGFKGKESLQTTFNTLQSETIKLKETLYSKALKTFDTHFEAYHADKEKLADYVRYLIANSPSLSDRPSVPNLHLLVSALDEENALDFKRVDTERKQLVERLVEKLAKPDLQKLVDKSVDYRAGRMGYGDYHAHLRKICLDHKISLSGFPQLTRYISYVLLADKIDRKGLLHEMDFLERTLPESLAKSTEEKKLVSLSYDLVLLNKLFRHEMTMFDWTTYQNRRKDIYLFETRMAELNPTKKVSLALSKETLKPFEDFCSYATQRNIALTDNFARQLAEEKNKSGILVAGGFHTEGLSALLRQRQISYVVVTPKITNVPTENNYLNILAKDPVPLEQLLAGDRIYLSDAIALASNSNKAKTLIAIKELLIGKLGKFVEVMKGLAVTTDRPTPENLIGEMSAQGIKVYFVRNYGKGSSILTWAKSQAEKIKFICLKVSTVALAAIVQWGKDLRPSRSLLARLPTTLRILVGARTVQLSPDKEKPRLPPVRKLATGTGEENMIDFETEVGRYEVKSGADIFIIAHRVSVPLGEAGEVFESLKIVNFSRDGKDVEFSRGPYGAWEFQAKRVDGTTRQIDSQQMSGIPHLIGEAPNFAGTALMAVMLKEVAGLGVPIVGVLAIKNAEAVEREILTARKEGRRVTFEDLQKVPALRDPECEYGFFIDEDGTARYTKKWLGEGTQSRLDAESTERLKHQENFDNFLRL